MRNADNNHDPRSGRHRPSPAGRYRGHRPSCQTRGAYGFPPGSAIRCTAPGRFLPLRARASSAFPGKFNFQPSAFHLLPTVPGPGGLLATLVDLSQRHFATGHYAAASAFVKLIRQPDPDPALTWERLGHLHFGLAEYEAAGRAYGYAAAYDPKDATLQVRLAHTCLRQDDIPSFEGYLSRALKLDPDNASALQLLADVNRDNGRYTDAARFYGKLLSANPAGYENLLSLALCYSYLGDQEAALDWLQRAGRIAREALAPATP